MNKRNSLASKVALGGVATALSIVFMMIAGVTSTLVYAIPMFVGALLIVLVIETGKGFATAVYVAVSILSLLILGNKEAAIMYVAFFGYYPILKGIIEKHFKSFLCWVIKYIVFNTAMVVAYFAITKIFMISFEDVESFGNFALPLLLLAGNIVFAMYDVLLTRLITIYFYRWQKYLKRVFK